MVTLKDKKCAKFEFLLNCHFENYHKNNNNNFPKKLLQIASVNDIYNQN